MAGIQVISQQDTRDFYLSGMAISKDQETLLTDAGRVAALAPYTLMAKVLATGKWVPFTDETAIDGTAIPSGVYLGAEIAAATIVAGDVVDLPILVGGDSLVIDENFLVIENSKTLATIIATGTINARNVEQELANKGIFTSESVSITEQQA